MCDERKSFVKQEGTELGEVRRGVEGEALDVRSGLKLKGLDLIHLRYHEAA